MAEKNEAEQPEWPQGQPEKQKQDPKQRWKNNEIPPFLPGQGAFRRAHNIDCVYRRFKAGQAINGIRLELKRVGYTLPKIEEYIKVAEELVAADGNE